MNNLLNEEFLNFPNTIDYINHRKGYTEKELMDIFQETFNLLEDAQFYGKDYYISEGVIKKIKYKVNKAEKKMDDTVANKIKKVQDGIKEDIREKEVKGVTGKVSSLIKIALASGVAWAVNPALAALVAITATAITKKMAARERDKLVTELKEELEITEEKIKDADNNGDKNKKYQLMRIRNQIRKSIQRVNFKEAQELQKERN